MIEFIGCLAFAIQGGETAGRFTAGETSECVLEIRLHQEFPQYWECAASDLTNPYWFTGAGMPSLDSVKLRGRVTKGDVIAVKCSPVKWPSASDRGTK